MHINACVKWLQQDSRWFESINKWEINWGSRRLQLRWEIINLGIILHTCLCVASPETSCFCIKLVVLITHSGFQLFKCFSNHLPGKSPLTGSAWCSQQSNFSFCLNKPKGMVTESSRDPPSGSFRLPSAPV